jgi:hypothetical protein
MNHLHSKFHVLLNLLQSNQTLKIILALCCLIICNLRRNVILQQFQNKKIFRFISCHLTDW